MSAAIIPAVHSVAYGSRSPYDHWVPGLATLARDDSVRCEAHPGIKTVIPAKREPRRPVLVATLIAAREPGPRAKRGSSLYSLGAGATC
jgi:hypothetical protein